MMYPFCKYADETMVTFSNIVKNKNGEEVIYVHSKDQWNMGLIVLDLNFLLIK